MNNVEIYIGKNGDVFGKYEITDLIEAIADGRVLPSDEAWYPGLKQWEPVCEVVPPLMPPVGEGRGSG